METKIWHVEYYGYFIHTGGVDVYIYQNLWLLATYSLCQSGQ